MSEKYIALSDLKDFSETAYDICFSLEEQHGQAVGSCPKTENGDSCSGSGLACIECWQHHLRLEAKTLELLIKEAKEK